MVLPSHPRARYRPGAVPPRTWTQALFELLPLMHAYPGGSLFSAL